MSGKEGKQKLNLSSAREEYRRDMKWLRTRFGIVPEARFHQVNEPFLKAIDALEHGNGEKMEAAVKAFQDYHRQVMKQTVWDMLEQTKKNLKAIRQENPELFYMKLKTWNRASWLFTNFSIKQSASVGGNYRKALMTLSKL